MGYAPVRTQRHGLTPVAADRLPANETAATNGRPPLPTLTVLRGLAALAVFTLHCAGELLLRSGSADDWAIRLTAGPGTAAVACFFVLSGFVLVWVARPGDTRQAFWRRRAAKVYPSHVVAWAAGLTLMVVAGREFNVLAVLPSLMLVQVWLPHPAVFEGTNGPAWTLACEVFFYALFPLLAVRVGRIRPERLVRVAVGLMAGVVMYTVLVAVAVPTEPRTETGLSIPAAQFYAIVFVPPVRLVEFVLGMVIARMVIEGRWPQVPRGVVAAALIGGYALSLVLPAPLGYLAPFLPAIALLLGTAASADVAGRGRRRVAPILLWLGNVSFAFYLVHWLVLRYARRLFDDDVWTAPLAALYFAAALALSLGIAHVLHHRVELPGVRRWARPPASAKRAEPEAAESPRCPW